VVVLAVLVGVTSTVTPLCAAGAGDAETHQRRASEARDKARESDEDASRLADEIADLDRRMDGARGDIEKLDPLVAEASERSSRLQTQMDEVAVEVASAQQRVNANTAECNRQTGLLAQRVQTT
jgi:peptidoglycan hydrolase CwlO-like protein